MTKQNRYEEALTHLGQALASQVQQIRYHLADTFNLLVRIDEATMVLETVSKSEQIVF